VIRGRFVYLAGADGTGKSTHARLLVQGLQARGIRCRHLWLRFPFFLSVPLLAYARWRGHSWYEVHDGIRYGYWDFAGSWLMREVFPWILLLDAAMAALLRVYLPLWLGATIVCERFVLDMLADLAIALDDPALHRRVPGKLYLRLLPDPSEIVILDLDARTARHRRPDLQLDQQLEARLETYHRLANVCNLPQMSTAGPLNRVAAQLQTLFGDRL
jgi:thymidylate kinase